jgi:ferredoxin
VTEYRRDDRAIVEVEVVPDLCMQFLNCARIAKGAFRIDPTTRRTRPRNWRDVDPEALWKAGWSCPSGAIRFVTDQGYVVPRWEEAARWDSSRHPAAGRPERGR